MGREREVVLGARWGLKPPLQGMLVYEAETGSGTWTRSHSKKVMSRDWDSNTSHSKTSPWSAESLLSYIEYG